MNERKATKRALLTSITALVMCVVMLAGTTFAWFTDTAKTNVNKIQAGNLDVALEMYDTTQRKWVNAEGKTLNFLVNGAVPAQGTQILWEPGCTYELPKLKVVNGGNLNIKYKVEVTGIQVDRQAVAGKFDLNDVIKWTTTGLTLGEEKTLKPTEYVEFTISGAMDKNAGNDYQGLSIDGVSITVYATQATGEFDSYGDQYDAAAGYPVVVLPATSASMTESGSNYTYEAADGTVKAMIPVSAVGTGTTPEISVKPVKDATTGKFVVDAGNGTEKVSYDISISGMSASTSVLATVSFKLGVGLTNVGMQHTGAQMMLKNSVDELTTADTFFYDAATGMVTIAVNHFSPFTVTYAAPVAMVNSTAYTKLSDAVAAAKDGDTITLLKNAEGAGLWLAAKDDKSITIDFNGFTYTVTTLVGSTGSENQAAHFEKGNTVTMKNGTLKVADSAASSAKILIQNYCNLTVSNMTLDGRNLKLANQDPYTLSNNDGVVKFTDCTVYAAERDNAIAVDAAIWANYNGADVTLENCTVYGKLDVAKYEIVSGKWTKTEDLATKTDGTPCLTVIGGSYTDLNGAVLAAQSGAKITLLADVAIAPVVDKNDSGLVPQMTISKDTVLDLAGKKIGVDAKNDFGKASPVLMSVTDGTLTINGEGTIDCEAGEQQVYGINVNGGNVVINGGTYYGALTAVQVQKGSLEINDGFFDMAPTCKAQVPQYAKYIVNCIDANYKNGTATISIKGGTFVNFDPSAGPEGAGTSYVADGYKVVSAEQSNGDTWYTVVPNT